MNKRNPYSHDELTSKFGSIPNSKGMAERARIHQGWWRLNVLNEIAGKYPHNDNKNLCNTIYDGEISGNNFLTKNIFEVVKDTLSKRSKLDSGKIEEERLYNNLLSSQPLCFNFFGELEKDKDLGLKVLKTFWKDITKLIEVKFEYAPQQNYTGDNSAFDVAFEVMIGNKSGLIGLECKYTDTFSYKSNKSSINYGDIENKNNESYFKIYSENKSSFKADYFEFVRSKKYNQLFRNQLIAEAMVQHKLYDVVKTGLFCYHLDNEAIQTGKEFSSMLKDGDRIFQTVIYTDFIQNVQKLDLTWEQREWIMMLWARYCGMGLSENYYKQIKDIK